MFERSRSVVIWAFWSFWSVLSYEYKDLRYDNTATMFASIYKIFCKTWKHNRCLLIVIKNIAFRKRRGVLSLWSCALIYNWLSEDKWCCTQARGLNRSDQGNDWWWLSLLACISVRIIGFVCWKDQDNAEKIPHCGNTYSIHGYYALFFSHPS